MTTAWLWPASSSWCQAPRKSWSLKDTGFVSRDSAGGDQASIVVSRIENQPEVIIVGPHQGGKTGRDHAPTGTILAQKSEHPKEKTPGIPSAPYEGFRGRFLSRIATRMRVKATNRTQYRRSPQVSRVTERRGARSGWPP